MSKVVLKGYVLASDEDISAVLQELPNHIDNTRQEEGCLVFEVTQDQENPYRLNVHEEFVDNDAFAIHQERVKNSYWGKVSANLERHYHVNER